MAPLHARSRRSLMCPPPPPPLCPALWVYIATVLHASAAFAASTGELGSMSLEELSNLQVTSVSKSTQPLRQAPASVYVITHDDILRSGVTTVSEALRLAPNLQITQQGATTYVAGARGFAGAQEAQNFSNKLLILIDGRSVYSPLFSGVYLDVQDVLLEDIDRIEVISGPGATLWGANAMHGVINIITRPSYLSDASDVSVSGGRLETTGGARFAHRISDAASFRVYAKAIESNAMEVAGGADAKDAWNRGQVGFRSDFSFANDTVTLQGDAYRGNKEQLPAPQYSRVQGSNLLGRWQRRGDFGDWQVQAYYDDTLRSFRPDGTAFRLHTADVELQHRFVVRNHCLIWGAGVRRHDYSIDNAAGLQWQPGSGTLNLGNAYAQDTVAIGGALELSVGVKAERDPYSGWNALPDIRLAWQSAEHALLWAAASRAIRSPTPFDVDVVEKLGTTVQLTGNASFRPELLTAYQLGYRVDAGERMSLDANLFYNVYADLRTIEPASPSRFVPFHWGNLMEGHTYGVDAWAKWQVTDRWRLSPGMRLLRKYLRFSPGASGIIGVSQAGNDLSSQAQLNSSLDVTPQLAFDATLRYTGPLPNPRLEAWYELNASVHWRLSPSLELSVSGFNLLAPRHLEYPAPGGAYILRSVIGQVRWTF